MDRVFASADNSNGIHGVATALAGQIVRVEANFLRLPLFALDTKQLRTMDGLFCEGTFRRAGKSFAFTYRVTRNVATMYPGPLARAAHFALLSLATEKGLPIRNPITFGWRQLCERMEISPSGKIVDAIRNGLIATKGLMIESRAALFSKEDNELIDTEESRVVGIYDQLEFFGSQRDDGSKVDINAVWLSPWYLDNLNALYSAPLDFRLWRSLNGKSPIASRLYEFLFFKFYAGQDVLRFNYAALVKFIPARTERYLSDAKKQLQPAFDLLIAAGILANVQWVASKGGSPQLLLHRGSLLRGGDKAETVVDVGEDISLSRIENVSLPEAKIVQAFHEAWGNVNFQPSRAELDLARGLIHEHGEAFVSALMPRVVKRLKVAWPDAKSFVAVSRYWNEVLRDWEREQARSVRESREQVQAEEERKRRVKQAQDRAVLQALWSELQPDEQEAIRAVAMQGQPPNLAKFPTLVERFCLNEQARRKGLGDLLQEG